MVQYDDLSSLAVADLPGLIRGSSENQGLGYAFLQHVQRCRLLLFVIDLSAEDPLGTFCTIFYVCWLIVKL